jgi:hypothetical protein
MFNKMVLKVLRSAPARVIMRRYTENMIEERVQSLLEDERSMTRVAMMRIIRSEAKDAIEELRERAQTFAELDEAYVRWAQTKRQTLLADEQATRAALVQAAADAGNPTLLYPVHGGVYVRADALFEGQTGLITDVRHTEEFPLVSVRLLGHREAITFAPDALEALGDAATAALREAFRLIDAQQARDAATELLPAVEDAHS